VDHTRSTAPIDRNRRQQDAFASTSPGSLPTPPPSLSARASHAMVQRPRSPKPPIGNPSKLGRLAKFFVSLYLLAAIFYTFYHFLLAPAFDLIAGESREGDSNVLPSRSSVPARSTSPIKPVQLQLSPQAKKHPALENAGVRAADIREEEMGDRVWQAAEASDKKGKKKTPNKVSVYVRPDVVTDGKDLVRKRMHGLDGVEWDRDQIHWHPPASPQAHSGKPSRVAGMLDTSASPVAMSEDHFLSLSFASSLQPSKVIPFYYRASAPDQHDFNKEDITITTLVTSNRFKVFERLVERYRGECKLL
jgi:hypothetical protein